MWYLNTEIRFKKIVGAGKILITKKSQTGANSGVIHSPYKVFELTNIVSA